MTQTIEKSHYRPDIDGLRALAVLGVVIYHAFPDVLPGGFIGVDVFFVISGYLISSILFKEISEKRFSFIDFYSRRIRRIFPALILVLAFCLVFGWFTLLDGECKQVGKHVFGGSLFISNFILWTEVGYFDKSVDVKPLLHLWSLAIEEQFYIIWPLLIWLAIKRKYNMLAVIATVALTSIFFNLSSVNPDQSGVFYSPLSRFWELLVGSAIAWLSLNPVKFHGETVFRLIENRAYIFIKSNSQSIGLFVIVFCFLFMNSKMTYPGVATLMPVLGAALIVCFSSRESIGNRFLTNRLVVWIGLLSYPIYLWHWPLLSFSRIIDSKLPSVSTRFILIILSILFSWLTYRLIEMKIRNGSSHISKTFILCLSMIAAGVSGHLVQSQISLNGREVSKVNAYSVQMGQAVGASLAMGCGLDMKQRSVFNYCVHDPRGNIKYAMVGDSKSASLITGTVRTSDVQNNWMYIGGNHKISPPSLAVSESDIQNNTPAYVAISAISKMEEIRVVVYSNAIRSIFKLDDGTKTESHGGGKYDYRYISQVNESKIYNQILADYVRGVKLLLQSGKKVVLVVDNPALPEPSDCMDRKTAIPYLDKVLDGKNPSCYLNYKTYQDSIALYKKLLIEVSNIDKSRVFVFDQTELYCDLENNTCPPSKNGIPLYSYTDHISDYASGLVGEKLNRFLASIS